MKKNSLSSKGLSLSQAQSISNLCNQRAWEIDSKLNGVNNYSKTVESKGNHFITVSPKPLPTNVVDLLIEKSTLRACQAFLMENIKAKDNMFKAVKVLAADISSVVLPSFPEQQKPVLLKEVGEEWGWEQLSISEICKYQEAEAFASHIGQFIHNGSVLDNLRKELPTLPNYEWMVIKDGEKTPVKITTHHTAESLLELHEKLAGLHRNYEQVVNYFKSKVKNLVTIENARISKLNADAQHDAQKVNNENMNAYQTAMTIANEEILTIKADFEKERQDKIKDIAALKIDVDSRFQKTVDIFLSKLDQE